MLKTELKKHINDRGELAYPHRSPISDLIKCLEDGEIHLIRSKNDDELFKLCAELCFPWMVNKQSWKNNHQHVAISTIITIADETLALLVLENNFLEWIELAKGNEINKKSRMTKYTHGGSNKDGTKKGWTLEGKLRFNKIFDQTQIEREKRESKQMEARIKTMWYNENPMNQRNNNSTNNETSTEEQDLELREQLYVPRTDFDLENQM